MIIEGTVVHGKKLGRTLGFPTANLHPENRQGDGPDGVYAGWLWVEGECRPCMVNIGHHPTLPGGGRSVEAHLFDFDGDLYGRRAVLETAEYIRGEVKFASPEDLRLQLEKDCISARKILGI